MGYAEFILNKYHLLLNMALHVPCAGGGRRCLIACMLIPSHPVQIFLLQIATLKSIQMNLFVLVLVGLVVSELLGPFS